MSTRRVESRTSRNAQWTCVSRAHHEDGVRDPHFGIHQCIPSRANPPGCKGWMARGPRSRSRKFEGARQGFRVGAGQVGLHRGGGVTPAVDGDAEALQADAGAANLPCRSPLAGVQLIGGGRPERLKIMPGPGFPACPKSPGGGSRRSARGTARPAGRQRPLNGPDRGNS